MCSSETLKKFLINTILLQFTGSLIYKLQGFDPDGDPLEFGVQSTYDSDIIIIRSISDNEAGIYLDKELDREVSLIFLWILLKILF